MITSKSALSDRYWISVVLYWKRICRVSSNSDSETANYGAFSVLLISDINGPAESLHCTIPKQNQRKRDGGQSTVANADRRIGDFELLCSGNDLPSRIMCKDV